MNLKIFNPFRKIYYYYNIDYKVFSKEPGMLKKRLSLMINEKLFSYIAKDAKISKKGDPLDVIIPSIDKDYEVLPYTIQSIREFIDHPINKIKVISPFSEKIVNICRENECFFIDENSVSPISKSKFKYDIYGIDNRTWIFQQLLKLNADMISSTDDFLIFDSDTILINPYKFKIDDKYILFFNEDYTQPFFNAYENIMKEKATCPASLITHFMIFNKGILQELKAKIEELNNTKWYIAILNDIDPSSRAFFAEYETYGNYIYSRYPQNIILKYYRNKSLKREKIKELSKLKTKYKRKYLSLSFHCPLSDIDLISTYTSS